MFTLPVCPVESYVFVTLTWLGLVFPIFMFGLLFLRKKITPGKMFLLQLLLFFLFVSTFISTRHETDCGKSKINQYSIELLPESIVPWYLR